ncbi:ketopantoate reductase family protein [Hyphomicrobium sp.]|uniref:ketopantoate reductase family protein n=1 Tax=Hyphomicrobium sp. TaxID=82 RepID=UPI003F6FC3AF
MKILILGAGAVGGYVGAKLQTAGADVVFLARGRRLDRLSEQGLIIDSPLGSFSTPARTTSAPHRGPPPDLIVIACKSPALDDALEAIAPAVGPATRILSFLNGVAQLETMHRRFPDAELLGGVAHGALTLRDDGTIAHLSPFFSAIVGPVSGHSDPVAESLIALLSKAETDARLSHDIRQDLWNKFVFLTTLAGATCLMRASIGTILACADGERFIVQLLDECLAVARAEGFAPDEASMTAYRKTLTEPGSTQTSSMFRDVQSGRQTEADHILGDMLRRATHHGIDAPLLKIVNVHLQCYEATVA